ncbi:MAG: hypothetical protein LUE27_00965 [Clostridia bacterium]|nr:hypothetical protein [Clostridia bacterium]
MPEFNEDVIKNNIEKITEDIFNIADTYSAKNKQLDISIEKARSLVSAYGWENIFPIWRDYIYNRCTTFKSAYVAVSILYFMPGAGRLFPYQIDNPYEFVAYLYCRLKDHWATAGSMWDSLTKDILFTSAGREELIRPYNDWYYPEDDPLITAEIEKWKEKLG